MPPRISGASSCPGPEPSVLVPVPPDLARTLTAAAIEAPDQLLARLHSHPDGLDAQQAARIRRRTGENVVLHEKPLPAWLHLWHCYVDPFNLLLSVLAAASWYSGDLKATTVIGCMVVLSLTNYGRDNEEIMTWLAGYRRERIDGIIERIRQGVQCGELPENTDIQALGDYVATLFHGISVQARDGVSRARLMAMTDIAMHSFDAMTAPPVAQ